MSIVTYLAEKSSATLEKTACSVAGGFLLFFLWHWLFDIIANQTVIREFSFDVLFTNHQMQFEFLIAFFIIAGSMYILRPVEIDLQRKLSNFYKIFLISREEYDDQPALTDIMERPLHTHSFPRMYEEIQPLKDSYHRQVGYRYLLWAIGISLLIAILFLIKYSTLDLSSSINMMVLDRFWWGSSIVSVLLFGALLYLRLKIIRNDYISLRREGLLVLHAYELYNLGKTKVGLDLVKNGAWTEIREVVATMYDYWENLHVPKEFMQMLTTPSLKSFSESYQNLFGQGQHLLTRWLSVLPPDQSLKDFVGSNPLAFGSLSINCSVPPYNRAFFNFFSFLQKIPYKDILKDREFFLSKPRINLRMFNHYLRNIEQNYHEIFSILKPLLSINPNEISVHNKIAIEELTDERLSSLVSRYITTHIRPPLEYYSNLPSPLNEDFFQLLASILRISLRQYYLLLHYRKTLNGAIKLLKQEIAFIKN